MKIAWVEQALEDVEEIRRFISRDSPRYADHLVEGIVGAVERLSDFPFSGRVVPELRVKTIREVLFRNFRIVFLVTKEEIQILTVFHGSRRFPTHKGPRAV